MTDNPSPARVTDDDQAQADLREVLFEIRKHLSRCSWDPPCPGTPVAQRLIRMNQFRRDELLRVALLRLARRETVEL